MAIAEIFQLVITVDPFFSEKHELTSPFTLTTAHSTDSGTRLGWTTISRKDMSLFISST